MSALPYVDNLEGRDPVEVLAETPARWAKVLEGVSVAQADVPTAPGKWSLREIAIHMADCEIVWGWRLRFVYGDPKPVIQPFDQDSWAAPYSAYTLAEARATYAALRAWNLTFLKSLSDADKQKPYMHPERGEGEVLWNIAEIMAGHDLHHLKLLGR